ncbi:MAG: type II toxin-antitoxin system HigB family toxin [Bacteroidota bacterium]
MNIVFLTKLNEFSQSHANARNSLTAWKKIVEKAIWKKKQDLLNDFPRAKMIANSRARFEIVHNTYRLIVFIDYDDQIVEVRFIGTHNDYDRIDPTTI